MGLGSASWALTSLGCPEGRLAPPASEPLTWDHQPLVSTAPVAGSSFPAPEPLMSRAHRYLSLRSQLRRRLLRDPFPGSSRLGTLSWGLLTITLGHDKPRGQEGGTPSPLCPPCPEQGRAQEARAEGIRMERGHNGARAVMTEAPRDAPGLHPRRYPQPQVGGGLNSADFPSFCN